MKIVIEIPDRTQEIQVEVFSKGFYYKKTYKATAIKSMAKKYEELASIEIEEQPDTFNVYADIGRQSREFVEREKRRE
jgi:hypothetical protein